MSWHNSLLQQCPCANLLNELPQNWIILVSVNSKFTIHQSKQKSIAWCYVNFSLELHVVSTFWLGSDTPGTFSLHLFCPAIIWTWETSLGKWSYFGAENWHFSYKFPVKVSLMLENPFLVPSRCKTNHISLCLIQINTKLPAKLLVPLRESAVCFKVIPGVLGRSVDFNTI